MLYKRACQKLQLQPPLVFICQWPYAEDCQGNRNEPTASQARRDSIGYPGHDLRGSDGAIAGYH